MKMQIKILVPSFIKQKKKNPKKRRPVLPPCKSRPTDKVKLPAFLPTS